MIRFRTLGALALEPDQGPELRTILAQPKRLALLAYLALARPRGFHRRDRLLAIFWPDADGERARAALSRAVYFLRRELGEGIIVNRGDEELAIHADRFWCDAVAFEGHLERGEQREALELYHGDLLPGFFTSGANGFEEWLEGERARLRERAAEAVWGLAHAAESRGNVPLAVQWARRGVELAPFHEAGFRKLLALLDAAGDRAGASIAYEKFAARLATELELAPAPETRALIAEIRARDRATMQAPGAASGAEPVSAAAHAPRLGTPAVAPQRRRRWLAVAAAVLVVGTPAIVLARGSWRHADARRVYVSRFTNLTGDRGTDALGRIVADGIVQSLAETGLVDVLVPDGNHDSIRGTALRQGTVPATEAGFRRRAGIVVEGEIHRVDGRLRIQARITDTQRGRVVWAVPPVSVTDSAQRAIDEVRDRTTGAVAALTTPRFATWFPTASAPPRFEAFQEFAHGVELQLQGGDRDAVEYLRRAVTLDSAFVWAQLQLAHAYHNLYIEVSADSIAAALNAVRERLNPLQRHWLDLLLSQKAEDPLGGYRAVSAAAALAPQRFLFDVAQAAWKLNRHRETVDVLTRLGPDSPYNYEMEYWSLLTRSYHALGDRTKEHAAAREARRRYPNQISVLSFELAALAADGRIREVGALLDTALAFPRPKIGVTRVIADMYGWGFWPGRLMIAAATDLRAHGFPAAADEVFERAVTWYSTQPPADDAVEAHRFELARALYLARDWPRAEAEFRSLSDAVSGNNFVYWGFLGTIAARRGDSITARRIIARFDSLRPSLDRPHAIAGYWQAKISALLGDEARAMTGLAESLGPQGRAGMHSDFDFERMWKSPPFREFVRPKG